MQPASKRVRSIYSVIASPNRLEILRILNTKGPLSYSELKTLAGFKSKKESGKFAYHLRKLVRQTLIILNRAERKYVATSLGRLVLNLTRQIEEQSVIERGKLYVRTSRQAMEEFNADRILQSLVREAGMPVELAEKITSETEARLQKFQATYLTAPLIREMVNALLIEHGYEEYRHKLTRLGLPIYDVTELVNRVGGTTEGVDSVIAQTAQAVFSEYLLLAQLPRDVADAHLSGDLHISNAGIWGLLPDTLFVDLSAIRDGGLNMGGKLVSIPRISPPTSLDSAASTLMTLASLLSREVGVEVSLENFVPYFASYAANRSDEELREAIRRTLIFSSSTMVRGSERPVISLHLGDGFGVEELSNRVIEATLEAYRMYVESTPVPRVKLISSLPHLHTDQVNCATIAQILRLGGCIAISTDQKHVRSYGGLRRNLGVGGVEGDWVGMLHSLSLNLPRLSYESSRDETYFRAKLALLLQLSISALTTRRRILEDLMKKNLLPTLSQNSDLRSAEDMPLIVNLVGLNEATSNLVREKTSITSRRAVAEKTVETAVKVAGDQSAKTGQRVGVAMLDEDGGVRFAKLDSERYGKAGITTEGGGVSYSQTPLVRMDDLSNQESVQAFSWFFKNLNGGYSVKIDVPEASDGSGIAEIIGKVGDKLDFLKLYREIAVCKNCGSKVHTPAGRCMVCRSVSSMRYGTA